MPTSVDDKEYGKRLREARERSGKTIDEMAALLDISRESYYDLEAYDEEIVYTLSLQELVTLSKALGFDLVEFLSSEAAKPAETVSLSALAEKINEYVSAKGLTVAEFEDEVGWEVANFLTDPGQFMNLNLDGLMDITRPLGVDWRAVLSGLAL